MSARVEHASTPGWTFALIDGDTVVVDTEFGEVRVDAALLPGLVKIMDGAEFTTRQGQRCIVHVEGGTLKVSPLVEVAIGANGKTRRTA